MWCPGVDNGCSNRAKDGCDGYCGTHYNVILRRLGGGGGGGGGGASRSALASAAPAELLCPGVDNGCSNRAKDGCDGYCGTHYNVILRRLGGGGGGGSVGASRSASASAAPAELLCPGVDNGCSNRAKDGCDGYCGTHYNVILRRLGGGGGG
ncbi:hypothetical protein MNEG_12944, partial [Monoraphidium neglectum]